ncbi:AP-3 complex subunit delta-1-like isoform X3 [Branchiostoma floridae x Branchiostoma japonicum]
MALKKVKGSLERVFDKNLHDLVRGIRNHKDDEAKFIAQCIDEIKQELRQDNIAVKANAVAKLTYLQMLGYDISWAAFNVIEVMSSNKFTFKRIGYLAASQSFHEETEVLMLTTNMIRKDLSSQNQYDAAIALNGLSCFMTPDLARDLANDVMTLMTSTRPYIRKRAVLIMYKIFLKFPEALRPAFPRLKEKLEDPDPGVQSAAVNVICELARKNPKNYLSLAPVFFKLMTSSTNNWVLIKIIKLFGALTPLEPRLGKKLIEPLTNLIHSTSAMSLLYECINTVIAGMPNHNASIQLCVQKLRILIEDSDQNYEGTFQENHASDGQSQQSLISDGSPSSQQSASMKYLGLLAMSKILKTHPKSVQAHKDLILQCLDDKDESIRLRALDLLYGMVSKKNLMEIVRKLMIHMDKAEGSMYRDELLSKIVQICSQNNYQYITNFEWYVSVLVELTRVEGTRHGSVIASQMLDVAIRVKAIRAFAVEQMAQLLENSHIVASSAQRNGICEVLYAAAWIAGEFSEHLRDPKGTLEDMLRQKVTSLPGHIQAVFVQNIMKLYAAILVKYEEDEDNDGIREVSDLLVEKLPMFVQSGDLEVQERACCILQLMKYVKKLQDKDVSCADEVSALFAGELNPVAPKAQRKVAVPEGLDLDKWINDPPSESSDEEGPANSLFIPDDSRMMNESLTRQVEELSDDELERRREARRAETQNNPHYLKLGGPAKGSKYQEVVNVEDIPVANIDLSVPLYVPAQENSPESTKRLSDKYLEAERQARKREKKRRHGKKSKRRHKSESEEDMPVVHKVDIMGGEMPEGATESGDEGNQELDDNDPHKLLDIDLDRPLEADEKLPVRTHRIVSPSAEERPVEEKKKHHRKDKEKEKKKKEKEKKKSKKEKKRNKSGDDSAHPSLLIATELMSPGHEAIPSPGEEEEVVPPSAPVKKDSTPKKEEPKDDLDFWLSGQDAPVAVEVTAPEAGAAADVDSDAEDTSRHKKKKEKKAKKEKKEKKDKKEKKKKSKAADEDEEIGRRDGFEELASDAPALPPMSSYRLLAEDSNIKMTYETRVQPQQGQQLIVSVIFTSLAQEHLKSLEFNVMDSLNTKMDRLPGATTHDGVPVPFQLPPNSFNEGQFAFQVQSINVAQKLRGTLTYTIKTEESSTSEKLDFKLYLPCTAFLIATPCSSDAFARLLQGGDLSSKYSIKLPNSGVPFSHILAKVCFYGHFAIVEQIDQSASLYSCSTQGHHICLLVKANGGGDVSIDGKCADGSLLSNVMEEIKVTAS